MTMQIKFSSSLMDSGGSNTEHSKSKPVQNQNFLTFEFGMVGYWNCYRTILSVHVTFPWHNLKARANLI